MLRFSSKLMTRDSLQHLRWLVCVGTLCLLGFTGGCTTDGKTIFSGGGGGNPTFPVLPTTRVVQSTLTVSNGQTGNLTLNLFPNGTLSGSIRFTPSVGAPPVTIVLNGTYNTTTLSFNATGTGTVSGVSTSITVSGTLPPDSGTGGNASMNLNGNTFQGNFAGLPNVIQGQMLFSNLATPSNANTSDTTFGNITATLGVASPGQELKYEARLTNGNTSRVLNVILRTASSNGIALGATFPINYTGQAGAYSTTIVYGEQGTFQSGFARSWVARSGTLVIDNIFEDRISVRLYNARFEPFTEVAGNPAQGSFTVNYKGETTSTGGGGGGGGGTQFAGRVLLANIPMGGTQNGILNMNVQGDGGISGTFRFDSANTRAVITALLSGASTNGNFTANGTVTVDGSNIAVTVSGTLPTGDSGGSFTLKAGTKTFTGTFSAPVVLTNGQAQFSSVVGMNGNSQGIVFDDVSSLLNLQANPGELLQMDARPIQNSTSRAVSVYLRTALAGQIVPGAVFPIYFTQNPAQVITQVIYGEEGDSSKGFRRMWVARSGSLVIDNIQGGVVTARILNCQMSPLSEVANNQAQGTFTLDMQGRTTPGR